MDYTKKLGLTSATREVIVCPLEPLYDGKNGFRFTEEIAYFSFSLILNFSHLTLIGLFPEGAATGAHERQHESLQ